MIFKPTLSSVDKEGGGYTKGNVDAELVLHAMVEYPNYDKAIVVSGDGDFHCLVDDLVQHESEKAIRAAGRLRTEGKNSRIRDGDVMRFLFSV